MDKKRVVMYVRKSRLKEDDAMEIERQLELLVDYANNNNMEYDVNTDIFKEEGSSEDWNRYEFQRMLKALESGIYDGVLVTEQDRISRDSTDMGLFKRFCINHSLFLFTLSKTYNFFNDEDNFMSGIQGEMDAHFMRITKRKLMRGRIKALNDGVYFGIAPLGYIKPNSKPKRLIIDSEKSKAIELIFDMYVNKRMTQTEIADRLNLLGFKTLYNKPFTVRATSLILSNEAYIGTLRYELNNYEPIVVENAHPAIIDKETFEKAQIILAEKRVVPQDSRRGTYLLSKLVKCAKCGTTLSFSHSFKSSTRIGGKSLYFLNCYASLSAKRKAEIKNNHSLRCDNYGSPVEYVEEYVMNMLGEYVDDLSERIENLKNANSDMFEGINEQIELINKRLNKLEVERKRVQDGYKNGIYESDEAQQLIKEIKENKLKLEYEKKELESKDSSSEINKLNNFREKVIEVLSSDETDVKKLNADLREIISHVAYYKQGRGNHLERKHPHLIVNFKV
ncbi:recombinase family protein [Lysinibacillus sp. BPa_S21]|uniref:recombinase family protein n=1 Tax=Lysinibacillus sp. BPa_S21 TaxID=2932478 RepID=UPI002010C891|nr:recombinase family protein [Lysinibacillus sp. BPa_S21]MCL1696237.1 recombinase family protein [Lysinibacillus sp. BPa_S21]